MYNNYQPYGSSYMGSMYHNTMGQGGFYPSYGQNLMSGVSSSFDNINRITQSLSASSESLHMAFSSIIRLFTSLRGLSQEMELFQTNFSVVALIKRLLKLVKRLVYAILGLKEPDIGEKVASDSVRNLSLSESITQKLLQGTDNVLFFTFVFSAMSFLKRLFALIYSHVSPYEILSCSFQDGQGVEVYLPKGPQKPYALSFGGQRCAVYVSIEPESVSADDISQSDSEALLGASKSENRTKKKTYNSKMGDYTKKQSPVVEMLAPNGSVVKLSYPEKALGQLKNFAAKKESQGVELKKADYFGVNNLGSAERSAWRAENKGFGGQEVAAYDCSSLYESNTPANVKTPQPQSFDAQNQAINSFFEGSRNHVMQF